MQKILLYYKFVPLKDPEVIKLWQQSICQNLDLKGRILLSKHGINGTVGGEQAELKKYIKQTKTYEPFKDIVFKWSEGDKADFPRLSVKVRQEIVTFGVPGEVKVNSAGIVGGGVKLKPREVHELVQKRGQEVVFFDGRNAYEAAVGKFKDAVIPDVAHTRDFKKEIKNPKYDKIKDRPVVTYCTGGIRCEVLSMLMKKEGFKEVYQIDGGIVKYGEEYGDKGLWEGSLYVFDGRMGLRFSEEAKDIGKCTVCSQKTSNYENCANLSCNKLVLICKDCASKGAKLCNDCSLVVTV